MPQKSIMKLPPPVNCRLEGWARTNDQVVVIIVNGENVRIVWGCISSHPTTGDKIADNVTRTAVWGKQPFNSIADNADDAHERDFDIEDPHLVKQEEAYILCDIKVALIWFEEVYPQKVIRKISRALRLAFRKK